MNYVYHHFQSFFFFFFLEYQQLAGQGLSIIQEVIFTYGMAVAVTRSHTGQISIAVKWAGVEFARAGVEIHKSKENF